MLWMCSVENRIFFPTVFFSPSKLCSVWVFVLFFTSFVRIFFSLSLSLFKLSVIESVSCMHSMYISQNIMHTLNRMLLHWIYVESDILKSFRAVANFPCYHPLLLDMTSAGSGEWRREAWIRYQLSILVLAPPGNTLRGECRSAVSAPRIPELFIIWPSE